MRRDKKFIISTFFKKEIMSKKLFGLIAVSLVFVLVGSAQKIMGFTDANAAKQLEWEKLRSMALDTMMNI